MFYNAGGASKHSAGGGMLFDSQAHTVCACVLLSPPDELWCTMHVV